MRMRRASTVFVIVSALCVLPGTAEASGFSWDGPLEGAVVRSVVDIYGMRDIDDTIEVEIAGVTNVIQPEPGEAGAEWWQYRWDCFDLADGPVSITVRRFAGGVLVATVVREVVVRNAPTFAFTSPRMEDQLAGTVPVTGKAKLAGGIGAITVEMRRRLFDGSAGETYPISIAPAERWSGTWATEAVPEGEYTMFGRASNAAGESATSDGAPVFVDRSAPSPAITSPSADATVSDVATIRGSVHDATMIDGFSLTVGGLAVPNGRITSSRDATGETQAFETTVDTNAIADGPTTIVLTAYDAAGHAATAVTPIVIDNRLPVLGFDTPTSSNQGGVIVIGGPTDKPLSSVTWSVDGGPWSAGTSAAGRWSASLDTDAWADGFHDITVRGTDARGRVASVRRSIAFRNRTLLAFSSASEENVSGTATFRGTASDPQGVSRIDVEIAGVPPVQADYSAGAWSASIDTIALTDGWHTVTARAIDGGGKVETTTKRVYADNAPVATIDPVPSPVRGVIALGGSVSSARSIASVTLVVEGSSVDVTTEGNRWTASLDTTRLDGGWRILRLTATDVAGGRRTVQADITVDNDPPQWELPPHLISGPFTVSAYDAHGVQSLTVRVGDTVAVGADGQSSVTLDTTPIEYAETLEISARDVLGNAVTRTYVVVVDNGAPRVLFAEPATYERSDVTISGIIEERDLVAYATISIDGGASEALELSADDGFAVPLRDLATGRHEIVVTATDRSGNLGTGRLVFEVDASPPTLQITRPGEGTMSINDQQAGGVPGSPTIVIAPGPEAVAVDATDDRSGVVSLTYCITGASGTPTCHRSAQRTSPILTWVYPGEYELTVTAEDALGNRSTSRRRVIKI